jgi:hypothetical protein
MRIAHSYSSKRETKMAHAEEDSFEAFTAPQALREPDQTASDDPETDKSSVSTRMGKVKPQRFCNAHRGIVMWSLRAFSENRTAYLVRRG